MNHSNFVPVTLSSKNLMTTSPHTSVRDGHKDVIYRGESPVTRDILLATHECDPHALVTSQTNQHDHSPRSGEPGRKRGDCDADVAYG